VDGSVWHAQCQSDSINPGAATSQPAVLGHPCDAKFQFLL